MQTILGSGGIIGVEASFCLNEFTSQIRQVSRKPKKVNETDQIFPADLRIESEVRAAVKGSEIVYLTAGMPYNTKIWQETWPKVMQNTLKACEEHGAKLVFFDNVYMYGKVDGWMTEETPTNPCSKKGEVRAKIAQMFTDAVARGNIAGLIARSADFYGPKATNTFVGPMVFEKIFTGKKAQFLMTAKTRHSLTYTPDAARAMVILGNDSSAFGQIWHLPTDSNALTGEELVAEIAAISGLEAKYEVLKKWKIQIGSLFSPIVSETVEMLYQFNSHYLFDSTKFNRAYHPATTYQQGIKTIYQSLYHRKKQTEQ